MSLGINCIVYVAGCDDHHSTFRWRNGTPGTCGLFTRNDNDFSKRFPLVVAAVAVLPVRSCLIDGEAIVSDEAGLAVFDLIRSWPTNLSAVLCAKPSPGIAVHEHYVGHGEPASSAATA
jgi:hypothetical protein